VLLALAIVARVLWGEAVAPARVLSWLRAASASPWAPLAYLGLYAAGSSLLVPASVFHVSAAVAFGPLKGILYSAVCMNLVSNAQFWVGRRLAGQAITAWLTRRGFGVVQRALEGRGVLAMLALRQLPLPFVVVNAGAGTTHLRWRDFVVGSGLGGLVPVVTFSLLAAEIAEGVEGASAAAMLRAGAAGAALIAVAWALNAALRRATAGALPPDVVAPPVDRLP
jgi:uncharacterized membrane protein YdjX (TVP38/TMEM64 family)